MDENRKDDNFLQNSTNQILKTDENEFSKEASISELETNLNTQSLNDLSNTPESAFFNQNNNSESDINFENLENNTENSLNFEQTKNNIENNLNSEKTENDIDTNLNSEKINVEDANTTNCLALTIKEEHKLVAVKNVFIHSLKVTWKVIVSTVALHILKIFF